MRRDFDPCEIAPSTWALVDHLEPILAWWFLAELRQAFDERRDFTVKTFRAP